VTWPRLLLGEDWASGEPIVCPLLEGGGPRARCRFSGVGFPCPRLGSGEARSCPLNGPILGLIAPIRPLQLCDDGGYQLRFRSLEGTLNYGPRQVVSAFRPRGVPGPTSKLSLRVPAQMGRRETGHKGERTVRGNHGLRVVLRPGRLDALAVGGYKRSPGRERERARALCVGLFSRAANLFVREPWTFLL
jgi:hypothetical protein